MGANGVKIEILIYIYLAICASMICFNIVCIFVFKHKDHKLVIRSSRFEKQILMQISLMKKGLPVEKAHVKYLENRLENVRKFLAFDHALQKIYKDNPTVVNSYFIQCKKAFEKLATIYEKKTPVKSAYYPNILAKYRLLSLMHSNVISDVLIEYIRKNNFYCRQNALIAIFSSDDAEYISKAVHIVGAGRENHNSKLICEGLLKYCNNKKIVCNELLKRLDDFSIDMQVSIVDLCRLSTEDYNDYILHLFENESTDDEVRFACIRYFTDKPWNEAHKTLIRLNNRKEINRWEYVALSSKALGKYPAADTIESLKRNLYSSNWYIRFNSANSLTMLGLDYNDLIDVFEGNDRCAQEVMQYRLDVRKLAGTGGMMK